MIITANPDVYGRYAQASALADYLELLAIHGVNVTQATMVDFIQDSEWTIRPEENFVDPQTLSADDDEPPETSRRILGLILERDRVLGDWYPFTVDGAGRVSLKAHDNKHDSYLFLLTIATAHAHRTPTTLPASDLFPETVMRVYENRGWSSANFGAVAKGGKTFKEALEEVGSLLALPVNPKGTILSKNVKDAGVDCVSHFPWCDTRLGRWIAVTQVTCASSNDWRKKLFDAQPNPWRLLLGEIVNPSIVLAIPHHAEPRHRVFLFSQSNGDRFLLDRLSLARHVPLLTVTERDFMNEVLAIAVEWP